MAEWIAPGVVVLFFLDVGAIMISREEWLFCDPVDGREQMSVEELRYWGVRSKRRPMEWAGEKRDNSLKGRRQGINVVVRHGQLCVGCRISSR